eukprot:8363476-Alexandrium_andersonii.AAC.1
MRYDACVWVQLHPHAEPVFGFCQIGEATQPNSCHGASLAKRPLQNASEPSRLWRLWPGQQHATGDRHWHRVASHVT